MAPWAVLFGVSAGCFDIASARVEGGSAIADGGVADGSPGADGGADDGSPGAEGGADVAPVVFFSGGVPVAPSALPGGGPAYPCPSGICIDMRKYWPTVAVGTMLIKRWDFMALPSLGDYRASGTPIRTQQYMHLAGAPPTDYVLVDHFTPPHWTHATWIDTWHVRYDGNTVVEYKDDANLRSLQVPAGDGIEFNRTVYNPGKELRWGDTLGLKVPNPSPTLGWATHFAEGSLTEAGSLEVRGDNTFELTDVRDDVIVNGVKYDNVAVVRIDQRACTSPTQCTADQAGTAAYTINYFYLAPGIGHIANFQYEGKFSGNTLLVTLSFGEALLSWCEKPSPAPVPQHDWQLAFDATMSGSPVPPTCP